MGAGLFGHQVQQRRRCRATQKHVSYPPTQMDGWASMYMAGQQAVNVSIPSPGSAGPADEPYIAKVDAHIRPADKWMAGGHVIITRHRWLGSRPWAQVYLCICFNIASCFSATGCSLATGQVCMASVLGQWACDGG